MRESHLVAIPTGNALKRRADHDLERRTLGEAMLREDALAILEAYVGPEDYDLRAHSLIFAAMQAISARSEALDAASLVAELKAREQLSAAGGYSYVVELPDLVASVAHVEDHAKLLADLALTRRIADAAREIEARACADRVRVGDLVEFASEKMFAATERKGGDGPKSIGDAIEQAFAEVAANADAGGQRGLSTGFDGIDAVLSGRGFMPGRLYILAARPGVGKSALAGNMARNVAGAGKPVLFISLEMPLVELGHRLLVAEARVDGRLWESYQLPKHDHEKILRAANEVYGLPIWIDDGSGQTLAQIRAKALRQKRRTGLAMLIVDYLQLVKVPSAENREQAVASVARGLKALAKELGIPVLAIAAMNREADKRSGDKRPLMSDLRESGSIEYDADLIAFLYRDELVDKESADKGVAEFIVRKQRNGLANETVRLKYVGASMRFETLDEYAAPDEHISGSYPAAAGAEEFE
jgi:replicative DNA helicase